MGGRLFWKFFFAFWLALVVAGVGVGVTVWVHRSAELERRPLAMGGAAATMVQSGAAVLMAGGVQALKPLLTQWQEHEPFPLYVLGADGRELLDRPVSEEALAEARRIASRRLARGAARELELPGAGRFLLFVPGEAVRDAALSGGRRHPRTPPPTWVPILFGVLASVGFSALLAWYLAKPVRYLRQAFAAAAAGDLDTRVQPLLGSRRDEIADLGREFDRMAGHLKALIEAQRRLFHDVSHELRSPLARLQAATGLARQDAAQVPALLDRIEHEAGRMDQLIGELLTLARLQSRSAGPAPQRFDLFELVEEIIADAAFEATSRGSRVAGEVEGSAGVEGDPELIGRAIENVVRNAIKFTPPGGAISVRARQQGGWAEVSICDQGPGVPPAQLEAIFEPFFRGQKGGEGTGLGLAIARQAVLAHGGSIQAANRPEGGLCVEIRLPV